MDTNLMKYDWFVLVGKQLGKEKTVKKSSSLS